MRAVDKIISLGEHALVSRFYCMIETPKKEYEHDLKILSLRVQDVTVKHKEVYYKVMSDSEFNIIRTIKNLQDLLRKEETITHKLSFVANDIVNDYCEITKIRNISYSLIPYDSDEISFKSADNSWLCFYIKIELA